MLNPVRSPRRRPPRAVRRTSRIAQAATSPICAAPTRRGRSSGPDFMRTWSGRSAQELVAFLGVTMPPPPAAPGSLGAQSYVNLAAFLLQANGAVPGAGELTAATSVTIGSVATGTMSEAFRGVARERCAGDRPGRRRGSNGYHGGGPARELPARHGRHAQALAGRRLAHDPRQLSGVELQRARRKSRPTTSRT